MASGTLDADKIRKEKSKWSDSNKVYTRRRKQAVNNAAAVAAVDSPATAVASVDFPATAVASVDSPATAVNNDQTLTNEESLQREQTLDVSNEPVAVENGVVRPIVTRVDDRVRIRVEPDKSKVDIIELKEKLKVELSQVRSLVQRLEDKEAEITHYSNVIATANNDEITHYTNNDNIEERYTRLEYPVNEIIAERDRRSLLRVNSDMDRRFESQEMSRFRHLSVSVNDYVEKEKRTPKANPYYRGSDFLLGKDRLPPESNKKLKPNGGRKSDYAVSLERQRNQAFRSCSNLLQRLMKHKHGWVFNEPVNAKLLGLHDYHDIIQHPMDLGTIRSRLAQSFYKTPGQFAEDVRLTFRNAMTYNPKGQDVHVMAEQLSDIFEERWVVIESDWRYGTATAHAQANDSPVLRNGNSFRALDRSQSMGLPFMARPKPATFAPVSRTPVPKKPKAKDLNKRDMTFEEKQKLSANLQSLPSEKLDSIVQIINKSNTSLSQNDDEIEVDIDSVDAETLWELDRFVTNYKKNLSKHKRKAEQAALAGNNNRGVQNPAASMPQALPETRADEQNPGASPANRGGENGSSTSSSSSDSSSSDSDSDSSSASDAGQ